MLPPLPRQRDVYLLRPRRQENPAPAPPPPLITSDRDPHVCVERSSAGRDVDPERPVGVGPLDQILGLVGTQRGRCGSDGGGGVAEEQRLVQARGAPDRGGEGDVDALVDQEGLEVVRECGAGEREGVEVV
ncbi:hypothetical protein LTR53_003648 [Teratosphaeriaceae sp. CCFEE 6253]|nr:hypothetical protein LTR53_003648 [Teratosphaeriaceae sp. CCFEE 6253]